MLPFKIPSRLLPIISTSLGALVELGVFQGFYGNHPYHHLLLCSLFFHLFLVLWMETFFFLVLLSELAFVLLGDVFRQ